jgi:hypothetical protein
MPDDGYPSKPARPRARPDPPRCPQLPQTRKLIFEVDYHDGTVAITIWTFCLSLTWL